MIVQFKVISSDHPLIFVLKKSHEKFPIDRLDTTHIFQI